MLTVALTSTLNLEHTFGYQPSTDAFLPTSVGTYTDGASSTPALRPLTVTVAYSLCMFHDGEMAALIASNPA